MDIIPSVSTIITVIFLLVILSYYFLLFLPRRKGKQEREFDSITVIIPSHNEERYLGDAIRSVLDAEFKGSKQVIVVDDGSIDRTYDIARSFKREGVEIIRTAHSGKSASINKALNKAKGELIAIVDGDSVISKGSLDALSNELSQKDVAAGTCVVRVKNKKKWICMWYHIEQLYNSLARSIFSKVNANITTPGPLSIYRTKELKEIGGFSTEGFAEDVDVTIRLIRKGYRVTFSEEAYSETNMPYDPKGIIRQRTRFARGMINVLKRHLKLNKTIIDIYTLPLFLFMYVQAVIMGSITLYQIISGYITYFVSYGVYWNMAVARFFFEWFSLYGFLKWTFTVLSGQAPLTMLSAVAILSSLLSYPLYFYAIFRYDRRLDIWNLFAVFFMFPFWLVIMVIYIICLPEVFMKRQHNIWKKNE